MTVHGLAPAFAKLKYTFSAIQHVQTIPLRLTGTPIVGTEPNVQPVAGGAISFSQFITDYMVVFKPMFGPGTNIESAEFWYQATDLDDPIWIFEVAINAVGTAGTAGVANQQAVITFRTSLGNIYKWYGMELTGAFTNNLRTPGASLAAPALALSNYLKGTTTPIMGRDGGRPIVPIWLTTKTNDSLRKRRLLI